jgi:hypothetical protein
VPVQAWSTIVRPRIPDKSRKCHLRLSNQADDHTGLLKPSDLRESPALSCALTSSKEERQFRVESCRRHELVTAGKATRDGSQFRQTHSCFREAVHALFTVENSSRAFAVYSVEYLYLTVVPCSCRSGVDGLKQLYLAHPADWELGAGERDGLAGGVAASPSERLIDSVEAEAGFFCFLEAQGFACAKVYFRSEMGWCMIL